MLNMLYRMLLTTASTYPTKTAIVYGERRVTYAALAERVARLSQAFRSLGIKRGDCVSIVMSNCPEFVESFYAIASLQAVALPLNPFYKEHELTFYLGESHPRLIVTDQQSLETCRQTVNKLGSPVPIMVIGEVGPGECSFNELVGRSEPLTDEALTTKALDAAVLYQFSSGSTGRPKRVGRTQRNLLAEANNFAATVQTTAEDVVLCLVPLFHAYGFGNFVLAPVHVGAKLVLLEPAMQRETVVDLPLAVQMGRIFELIECEHVTILPAVPVVYQAMLDASCEQRPILNSLRICFTAGNFLPKETFERFEQRFGIQIRQQYGNTESGAITANLESPVDPDSFGRPLQNVAIKIVDEKGQELKGEVGEVVIKSPSLTEGYHNLDGINASVFHGGWFYTGDLGWMDEAGRLYLTGRKRIFIDTGGYKVDPAEIEDVLCTHPQVAEAVVVGMSGADAGELIKAVIVPIGTCDEQEILSYCSSRLAQFKIPRIVEFRTALPRNGLGKILKKDLLDPFPEPAIVKPGILSTLQNTSRRDQRVKLLRSFLESQVAELFNRASHEIEYDRPLGDYGLDSISVFGLRNRLERNLGISFAPTLVWSYPTIEALAEHLTDAIAVL